ncbi:MAG: hypothetical protein B7X54_06520 [Idiomarina sp. 34-48-12]|nr:MAG: hypothetical protein B7X54_06520 [Idiomarina sp. 34-48-12]
MGVKTYSDLKSTGLQWAPQIPSGWEVKKSAYLIQANKGENAASLTKEYCESNKGQYPVYSGQTSYSGIMGKIDTYEYDFPMAGVLFSTTVGAKAMTVSHLFGKFSLSQNCLIFYSVSNNLQTRFAYYSFSTVFAFERALIPSHMQASFRMEDLYQYRIPLPPVAEQQKIAQFLDYETAKIDALIDEQKRLIELLKEKRQAVISHAVTKGLNPDAPMKDSGVEWLGEVPRHWEVSKIKWKLKTTSGGTPPTSRYDEYYEGEIPWIRTTDLNNSLLFETEIYVTQKAVTDTSCRVVPKNSVLIAMYGGDGTIGKHSLLMFDSAINQAVCALLPSNELRPKFLHDYIEFYRPFWMIGAESSRKDPNIGQDRIGDHFCLVPPISEQVEIENAISDLKRKYDSLQSESVRNIRILKERRSALISAAVTGKIDVRDWQPPAGSDTLDPNASMQTERHYG